MRKLLLLSLLAVLPASALTWTRYQALAGFSAEFPGTPTVAPRALHYHNGGDRLNLSVLDLEGLTLNEAYQNLDSNIRLYARDFGGTIVSKKNVKFGDFVGYRFRVSGLDCTMDTVWLVDGKVWVQASGLHKAVQSAISNHFLESVQLPDAAE